MASDDQIALVIIEGSIVAMPLWLGVIRLLSREITRVDEHDDTAWYDLTTDLIAAGIVVAVSVFSLLMAFISAAAVALGATQNVELSLLMVGIFLFTVAYQGVISLVSSASDVGTDRVRFYIILLGMILGIAVLVVASRFV